MPQSVRYRGRRGLIRALTTVGVVVMIVLVLAGTAYLFLRPYFAVTEEGLLISLPFWQVNMFSRATPEPFVPPEEIKLIIEQPPGSVQAISTPEPQSEPQPEPQSGQDVPPPRAVFLPQSALTADKVAQVAQLCEDGHADTVVLELKSSDGAVAIGKQPLTDAIEALRGKASLVGYISVLLDNTATRNYSTFALKHQSGVNWLDIDKERWINPFVPEAQSWLSELVKAAAQLPLEALLFDNLSFPVNGRQNLIDWGAYQPDGRTDAISSLAESLRLAADMPCWAVLQTDVCTGAQPGAQNASQDRAVFEELFGQVFVKLPQENADAVYEEVLALSGAQAPLPVILLPDEGQEGFFDIGLSRFEGYIAVSAAGVYPSIS